VKPLFHPRLVNGPFGDPALYVEFLYEKRALLFDLGDIAALAPKHILRVSEVFVSHTHMDHFVGFDRLLRICLGRGRTVRLFGPPGFATQVAAKLGAYTWNLVRNYDTDFTLLATEYDPDGAYRTSRFRCREGFEREDGWEGHNPGGMLLDEPGFRVMAVHLDHKIPCLAFRLEEKAHVNVWKSRLTELGLPTGPWLKALKAAVLKGEPDDTAFRVRWHDADGHHERLYALGALKARVLKVVPGQHVAYVVDAAPTDANGERILALARGADRLFIETPFLEADAARARATSHLTARLAGTLARRAGVARMVPFHFSARYGEDGGPLVAEAEGAFAGG
jgi:ribonuclease Z